MTTINQYSPRDENSFIVFETRQDAEKVLNCMRSIVTQYGVAYLADFFDLCGIPTHFTDYRVGWKDLLKTEIKQALKGFIIEFPMLQKV